MSGLRKSPPVLVSGFEDKWVHDGERYVYETYDGALLEGVIRWDSRWGLTVEFADGRWAHAEWDVDDRDPDAWLREGRCAP